MTLMLLAGMVQEAEHAGPASPFEVNFGLFFWTWAVFLVLLWMLKKFAFPAILKVTEEREQAIAAAVERGGEGQHRSQEPAGGEPSSAGPGQDGGTGDNGRGEGHGGEGACRGAGEDPP